MPPRAVIVHHPCVVQVFEKSPLRCRGVVELFWGVACDCVHAASLPRRVVMVALSILARALQVR